MRRTSSQIIFDLKKKKTEPAKRNVTFRLDVELMTKFKDKCKKQKLSHVDVLTELLKDFVET